MAAGSERRRYLPNSTGCFVCGETNQAGLQARFYVEDGIVKTPFTVRPEHCGYENVAHGGVLAAALDECMAWAAARAIKRCCVTAELTVRYVKRVSGDARLTVVAEVIKSNRRLACVRGAIEDEAGACYARAEGKFMPLSVEETLAVDDGLIYRGGEERVFDVLRAARAGTTAQT